jgi:hypothetical protein
MDIARKLVALFAVALLTFATAACTAEGEVGDGGAGVQVEGEGEGGEGGDD